MDKHEVAIEAAWEVGSLARVLLEQSSASHCDHLVVRGISARLWSLAEILVCLLDDDEADVGAVATRLTFAAGRFEGG